MSISDMKSGPVRTGKNRRIIYLSQHFGYPLGGVRIAHHHVAVLNRHGFDARIMLVTEKRDNFFEADIPIQHMLPNTPLYPTDIIVIPEPWNPHLKKMAKIPVRRIVFCQNHFYLYHGLGAAWSYEEYCVDRVFCCSEVISDYIKEVFKLSDVPVVRNGVDTTLFKPGSKRRQIAFMPRKMKIEALFIQETFRRLHPEYAEIPWIPISGVPETEVARILGESALFLALGRLEGFGLPPIEAMAAGCLVVGFTGDGGRSYATDENGHWCVPEDWFDCAGALGRAMAAFDEDGGNAMRTAGLATAADYALERMERDVVAFWDAEVLQ